MALIDIDHVSKVYGGATRANDDISLTIEGGEVFGLLGPNGAGKTTLVNQLVGLIAPTSGRLTIDGTDIGVDPTRARELCTLQPQTQVPIDGLTPLEFLDLIGRLRGASRRAVRRDSRALLDRLDLLEWANQRAHVLSGGVRRLVAFCAAAVVPGRVVVLDEPTNDVDPVRRGLLWSEIQALADRGVAVVLVTHNVLEAERAADRVALIDRGRVVACAAPHALKREVAASLRLELAGSRLDEFPLPDFAVLLTKSVHRLVLEVPRGRTQEVVEWASGLEMEHKVDEFSLGPATLEDVYAQLVGPTCEQPEKSGDAALAS